MIRTLREGEIEAVVPLLRAAYERDAPFATRLRRYLAIEPEGWFVVEEGGERVGMVGVVVHGHLAYVGLMAVLPTHQGRGLARKLMDHALSFADARGVTTTMLDASEAGAPLYLRSGFVEREKSLDFVYRGAPKSEPREVVAVDEVLALDRALFGADRARTLRTFVAERPDRLVAVRRNGEIVAHALAQSATIGPVVARDEDGARAVVRAALSLPFESPPHLLGPEANRALLEGEGFTVTRALRHMQRGPRHLQPGVFAKASFAVG